MRSDYRQAPWYALLVRAIAEDPRGRAGVAARLGVSRSAISQVVSGKYPARPDSVARAVLAHYARVVCPYLGVEITREACGRYARRACPTHSAQALRRWRACQVCPQREQGGEQ